MEECLRRVVAEDIIASEEIERMLALVGGSARELMVKIDTNAVEGHHMLQAMVEAEQQNVGGESQDRCVPVADRCKDDERQ